MALVRSLYRSSSSIRSSFYYALVNDGILKGSLFRQQPCRSFFGVSPCSSSTRLNCASSDSRSLFGLSIGSIRAFSQDVAPLPEIKDPEIKAVFKDFMAADWGELPNPLINDAVNVLSKNSDDNTSKESLKNVFRAAEAVEEFIGTLETLKMGIDDLVGMSGENVKPLPEHYSQALKTAYDRYSKYLNSFGPDEYYLKKKVETELGRRMIHLKMRCGGLNSEWGKVTVLGTSGISGSYVEQRAP